jgi:ABC-2 type transport system permease protein
MSLIRDTLTMAGRSLRHTVRSPDTIITVALTPIALLVLFVYVFGNTFNASSDTYVNFITPGIALMCVLSGIAYTAFRLNNDVQKGIINRFKTMPIAPSSILGGHAVSSLLSNLVSVALVMATAFLIGFRSSAGVGEWLIFTGILVLFTLATTWLAIAFGLLAKSAEGASGFSYILLLLVFISSAFTPADKMASWLRGFAQHQPMTPIVETMRSLLVNGTAGPQVWTAVAWCAALLLVSYLWALHIYKSRTA